MSNPNFDFRVCNPKSVTFLSLSPYLLNQASGFVAQVPIESFLASILGKSSIFSFLRFHSSISLINFRAFDSHEDLNRQGKIKMSVERSLEAWEEVQRHGQDLADRLAQGFTGLIHINPPSFPWPPNHHHYKAKLFDLEFPSQHFSVIRDSRFSINQPINGVSAILDIGNKIGQAGVDFGAGLNVMVQQFFRSLPIPFLHEDNNKLVVSVDGDKSTRSHRAYVITKGDLGLAAERLRDSGFSKTDDTASVTMSEEEVADSYLRTAGLLGRSKVTDFVVLLLLCFT